MDQTIEARPAGGLRGTVRVPGDKSVSHRSVMFAALGDKPVRVRHFLAAADCLSTVACMRAMGVRVDRVGETELVVHGVGLRGLEEPPRCIDAGNSGTTLRLMLGIAAAQPFLTAFTGDDSLHKRPMGRVIAPLSRMGARIAARAGGKYLPLAVLPSEGLEGIAYETPVASAQVKSAVLLAGLYANGQTSVTEPYVSRDHTERMLEAFGVAVRREGTCVSVEKAPALCSPEEIEVPGDISSAAFWLVAASVIPGSCLTLENVGVNPTRTGILDVLRDMGADFALKNERLCGKEPVADITVRAAQLKGTSFGAEIMPRLIDEIPVLTVAAMLADGMTAITGAGELRVKETDRLAAIAREFNKFAPCITESKDGLVIEGKAGRRLCGAACESYGDHRIAMALAVAGAAGGGAKIAGGDCIGISYPDFYETLERLRV